MQPSRSGVPGIPTPAESGPASAPRRRPFGLYAILILLSLQALLGVVVVVLLGLGFTVAAVDLWAAVAPYSWSLLESFILLLVVAVVVVGLWRYQLWAWYGMMLLLAYWMATDAYGYFTGTPEYLSMLLNVVMVFYLNQREVRELFDPQSRQEGAHV